MLVRNIYVRVAANFLVAAINFVPLILIVKVFGSEQWGKVIYYYSIAGVLSIFSDPGFSTAYSKFLATEDNFRNISAFFVIKTMLILLYVLVFSAMFFLKFRNSQLDTTLLWIVFLAMVLELAGQFFSATMVGKRDFLYLSVVEIAAAIVSFVYIIFICFLKPNIYLLAYSQAILPLVTIVGGFFYFRRKNLLRADIPRAIDFKRYISYSLPISFTSIFERLMSYLDKLILGNLLSVSEVGFYQIAMQCYAAVDRFIKPVTSTMFTEIAHRISKTESFFHKQFKDLVETLNFFGGLIVIVIVFAGGDLVRIFFGVGNSRVAFILQFLSLSVMGRLFWRPYSNVIFAIEKHRLISFLAPLNLIVIIAAYYLLIPLKIGSSFCLGAAALPITEFVTWLLPIGFLRIIILKKQFGDIHMRGIILKIWLPLAVVISAALFVKGILILPLVIFVFVLIEYFLNIINGRRLRELTAPLKQIVQVERSGIEFS